VEGLEALGNAGVVPIIIFLTQMIKTKIGDFKYGSDVLALGMSMVLCVGWTFYYMDPSDFNLWLATGALIKFKWGINQLIVGFATWLAASKIYDLGHGNKKREGLVIQEKKVLEEKIVVLQNGTGNGEKHEEPVEEADLSSRLREVLEERE
jgi:hypothetical protein